MKIRSVTSSRVLRPAELDDAPAAASDSSETSITEPERSRPDNADKGNAPASEFSESHPHETVVGTGGFGFGTNAPTIPKEILKSRRAIFAAGGL
ncbi:MAG: hypothetical protein IJW12_07740 [Opitutales bacterium]|nr:hypothetical protein [Opitutales bacterium]